MAMGLHVVDCGRMIRIDRGDDVAIDHAAAQLAAMRPSPDGFHA